MDINSNIWYGKNNKSFLEMIGQFIRHKRIEQNKTQQALAEATGLNRSTIVLIEKGQGGTMLSFIQILRALDALELLHTFEYTSEISPLLIAEMEKKQRKRASKYKKTNTNTKDSDW